MAGHKVWLRTTSLNCDRFVVGDIEITREGTEVPTEGQAKKIEELAATHGVAIERMEQPPASVDETIVVQSQEDGN